MKMRCAQRGNQAFIPACRRMYRTGQGHSISQSYVLGPRIGSDTLPAATLQQVLQLQQRPPELYSRMSYRHVLTARLPSNYAY